ncbi:MAG: O-antigen ligase family protein, partial [Chloroflexi bacterium]|nr:O-antigen ligase family protein [Chloroflexota bacterium]
QQRHISCRTPFDIPILLFLTGAVLGVFQATDRALSWGAFQTCLAAVMLYYTIVNYPRPHLLIGGGIAVTSLLAGIVTVVGFSSGMSPGSGANSLSSWVASSLRVLPQFPRLPGQTEAPNLLVHGLLLTLLVSFLILAGSGLFARRIAIRITFGMLSLVLLAMLVPAGGQAYERLVNGTTIRVRMDVWQNSILMAKDSWLTGIGLGHFPLASPDFFPGRKLTIPHNGYLELLLNYGILGATAGLYASVVVARLFWDILRCARGHPWFGFALGLLAAFLGTAFMAIFESSPMGIPAARMGRYFYTVSPLPWMLGGALVVVHRLVTK